MYETYVALAAATAESPALIDGESGEVVTRAGLLGRSRNLASRFAEAGLRRGDLVAIQLPNSVDFVAAILALWELDLVAVPIDRDATETEVAAVLGQFSVRGLIYRAHRNGDAAVSIRRVDRPSVIPTQARLIKLTSGSTGKPKGIVTSEANLRADCINICRTMGIESDDLNLGAIPFSHSYGFSNLVMPLLLQGTPIVVSNDYLPQSILRLTNRHRCTVVPAIPMVFEHLTTLDRADGVFESVRTFLSAGAPLSPAVSRRFRERFGNQVHVFYGCSECGGITYDRDGGAAEHGSVGSAMEGVAVRIDRRTARLTVRGEAVALGYLLDARTFQPFSEIFLTDDLAKRDTNGEIVLTGRAGDLINTAGKKVNPREVEQVLLQMEGVHQAKVYGEPAGARGEVVAAAIVASPDVTREQVRTFCRQHLSAHKVPRIVKLIESIPLDERGKVRRSALPLL